MKRCVVLDEDTQTIRISGKDVVLTHKAWRVLAALIDAAPKTVSRGDLIQRVWNDNHDVGEKGLNHALWVIRTHLQDDTNHPKLIKTVPRAGYRWIGPMPRQMASAGLPHRPIAKPLMGALAAGFTALVGVGLWTGNASNGPMLQPTSVASLTTFTTDSHGHTAAADSKQVLVTHAEGCEFKIKASKNKTFGQPSFSSDGERIAIPVLQAGHCSLVVIEFKTRQRSEFQSCPGHNLA